MLKFIHARFRTVVLISLILIIGTTFAAINIFFGIQTSAHTTAVISDLLDLTIKNEITADEISEEVFCLRITDGGDSKIVLDNSESDEKAYIISAAKTEALKEGRGFIDDWKYISKKQNDGLYVMLLNMHKQKEQLFALLYISGAACAIIFTGAYFVLFSLSKKLIAPVIKNLSKQKQFLQDAGHELKTPIAIITAANDVIEMTNGSSEWTKSIKKQSKRLSELTQDMMKLLKAQNIEIKRSIDTILLSETTAAAALDFKAAAKMRDLKISLDIRKDITVLASSDDIDMLLNILFDNAVKYAKKSTTVYVSLYKEGSKAALRVKNTCEAESMPDISCVFDKFYRADKSRSRNTGGSGLGLAIAKELCNANKASVTASCSKNEIEFTVLFSRVPKTI